MGLSLFLHALNKSGKHFDVSSPGEESEERDSVGVFSMNEVEHTCSSTESGYRILGNGNKHSF